MTLAALRERVGLRLELAAAGLTQAPLNVIASPVQELQQVFDLMPHEGPEDWELVRLRLLAVPRALDGYVRSLRASVDAGRAPALGQVLATAEQCDLAAGPAGFFAGLAARARAQRPELAAQQVRGVAEAAAGAAAGYARFAVVLRTELAPRAGAAEGVGREVYALHSRWFLGTRIDLEETYAWGLEELTRIEAEARSAAARVRPGASVGEAAALLDADPARAVNGAEAALAWMRATCEGAVEALDGIHFAVPPQARRIDCRLAPGTSGTLFYTPPSVDSTRRGTVWWRAPLDVAGVSTWRRTSTLYHEGVPGHHLQNAWTASRPGVLNRWRRVGIWVAGHGEGWALYAERLMADLGFLDDPGVLLGMLQAQALRAARVVVDIGVHLGLPAPEELGGGRWDARAVDAFLAARTGLDPVARRFEVARYLGWPGQAPSYKVGERIWLAAREEARARAGDAFDLQAFHSRALDLGSVGLDVLVDALGQRDA